MKVVRVNDGDYQVAVQNGGNITLNTGVRIGQVRVTGNLLVEGTTTTVQSEITTIKDNIIVLNSGETGAGVTLTTAGIQVDRGPSTADAQILWDENEAHYSPTTASTVPGTWVFRRDNGTLTGIQTNSIDTNQGVLGLINSGSAGYVTVTGTANYERNILTYVDTVGYNPILGVSVTDDDRIPNAKAMSDYVTGVFATFSAERFGAGDTLGEGFDTNRFQGVASFSGSVMTVISVTGGILKNGFAVTDGVSPLGTITAFLGGTGATGTYQMSQVNSLPATAITAGDTVSRLTFKVDNVLRTQIDANGITSGNVNITGNTVSSTSGGLTLDPNTGQVLIDGYLQLAVQVSDPAAVASNDMLYHKTIGAGDSGLYFRTTSRNDELVSKRRAILFGMIF
jgi:hypothetical protein